MDKKGGFTLSIIIAVVIFVVGVVVGFTFIPDSGDSDLEEENVALQTQATQLQTQVAQLQGQIDQQDNTQTQEMDYSCDADTDCMLVLEYCCGCITEGMDVDLLTAINQASRFAWRTQYPCIEACAIDCPDRPETILAKCNSGVCEVVGG